MKEQEERTTDIYTASENITKAEDEHFIGKLAEMGVDIRKDASRVSVLEDKGTDALSDRSVYLDIGKLGGPTFVSRVSVKIDRKEDHSAFELIMTVLGESTNATLHATEAHFEILAKEA